MIPDQQSEKPRQARILQSINTIETMVRDLAHRPEAPALCFNGAVFQMTGAIEAITSARNVAQEYHVDMSKLPQDKSAFPDYRNRMLAKLEEAVKHLNLTQQNIAHDTEGAELSLLFRMAVKRCDTAISDATRLIRNTVLEGCSQIQSQQSQSNILSEIRRHQPKASPKEGLMKLVVSNPSPDLH